MPKKKEINFISNRSKKAVDMPGDIFQQDIDQSNLTAFLFNPETDVFWELSESLTIKYISPQISEIAGYHPEELINSPLQNFCLPKTKQILGRTNVFLQNHGDFLWSGDFLHKNGTDVQLISRVSPIFNEKNQLSGFSGFSRLTLNSFPDRKKTELNSKLSLLINSFNKGDNVFLKFFENTFAAIAIQTEDQIYLVNRAWEKLTGYNEEEAKQLSPKELIHPESLENFGLNKLNNGESTELRLVTKDNQEKWIDFTSSEIDYNEKKVLLIISNDITAKKQAEIQIKKLTTAIIQSPTSIVITDKDGNIEFVNPYFTQTTGYTFEEALGQNPRILKTEFTKKETYEDMWQTILSGNVWEGEFLNQKKNGELYWEIARIAPILDEKSEIMSFIAVKEDITKQKKILAIIEKSEKELRELNVQKDKFFSIIAHDLRGPLAALIGLTKLVKENYHTLPVERTENILNNIDNSANQTYKLLENLLEWARNQTGKIEYNPQYFNVAAVISEAIVLLNLLSKNKEINITVDVSEEYFAFADKNMISTVIRNLISNAIKYSHRQGTIKIFASRINGINEYIKVAVKDYGVGIPFEKIEKIFQINENTSTPGTEKEKGTGLGLILCKEFIDKNNGEIWCESGLDQGCTFLFTIPVLPHTKHLNS